MMALPETSDVDAIDSTTRQSQAKATDPQRSAWVSANAGSGKTFVLSRRVIRLLLAGVDPARILCLTFTRAAAAEMAKRVFEDLARWTTLSDADLARQLTDVEGRPPDAALLAEARRLFARALDTPGGLKIQTVHALCERLLHLFPFEANVAGYFEVLEERGQASLAEAARAAVLARATAEPKGAIGKALSTVLTLAGDYMVDKSVAEFVARRDAIHGWIAAAGSLDAAVAGLQRELGVPPGETSDALRREIADGAPLQGGKVHELLERLGASGPSDRDAAYRLAPFVRSSDENVRIEAWLSFLMKDDGTRRSAPVTKSICRDWPGLDDLIEAEIIRLEALIDRIRTAELFETSVAMLRLAEATIAEYERLKRARGALDFEDLVVKTVRLLLRSDAARWVHYKLDRGLDHILVDEAQDTSPRQWQVVEALAAEFFAGDGTSDALRTLFAVGDEKQSIFSFQGALPAWFTLMQRQFARQAVAAAYDWSDLNLHLSFRSVPVVLEAVDKTFASPEVHRGLSAELRAPVHQARRRGQPGQVVIWPRYESPEKPVAEDWTTPVDYLGIRSPEVRLANRIADTIRRWLKTGERIDATGAPIRPGGILILTRTRGALTDAINRALKTAGVPIAGADRLILTDHIAVMDLMALGRVLLTPEDDLSLAALLKSPLIGLCESALYALAHGRKGSLWASLRRHAEEDAEFGRARSLLDGWRAEVDYRDPHGFFARVLAGESGRSAFLQRLGPEVDDVLDEFLAAALAFEQGNIPSLHGFLAWMEASETEVKRDTDTRRDEVRVMTVHGAKGLEADVVFLVDNGTQPSIALHDSRALFLAEAFDPSNPGPAIWMRSVKAMPARVRARIDAARAKGEEEYRRLLYVGMTRARDRLYVVGIDKQKRKDDARWHALVTGALGPDCVESVDQDGEVSLEWKPSVVTSPTGGNLPAEPAAEILPDWTRRPAPPPTQAVPRLSPSAALPESAPPPLPMTRRSVTQQDPDQRLALDRGRLVHRLLQSLPDHLREARAETGRRYLEAVAPARTDREFLLTEVLAILEHPTFAPVFAEGSRAEVEVAGTFNGSTGVATIAGRIDRLAVNPDRVLIVDYKTNRPAPATLAKVPRDYIAQLALYRRLLTRVYPDRPVIAAILWTDRPSLMEVPAESMDSVEVVLAGPQASHARTAIQPIHGGTITFLDD
jgi:ATP-dependent helicase/nuclease subunit A